MKPRSEEWYKTRLAIILKREAKAIKDAAIKLPNTTYQPLVKHKPRKKPNLFFGQNIVWKDWNKYQNTARWLTRIADKSSLPGIELHDRANYQVDHIVSVWDGYKHNINPALIAALSNLRVIPTEENKSKGSKSPETALLDMIELNKTYIRPE